MSQYRVYNAEAFGQAVKHFRRQAWLTQAELARQAGISRTYLAELETGHFTEQTQRLVRLFKELGLRITIGEATSRAYSSTW